MCDDATHSSTTGQPMTVSGASSGAPLTKQAYPQDSATKDWGPQKVHGDSTHASMSPGRTNQHG